MRPFRHCALTAAALSLLAAYALPAQAACKRFGFLVNDYGKEGPARDAKALLDKQIKKWMNEKGITKYQVGKKHVTCELFLDVGLFDEYTCTAKASACWGEDQTEAVAENAVAENDDEFEKPPAPPRKAEVAPETAATVAAAQDATQEDAVKTAEQAAEEAEAAAKAAVAEAETAARQAAEASKPATENTEQPTASTGDDTKAAEATAGSTSETAKAVPAAAPVVETGALPTDASAAAAEVARTSPEMAKSASPAGKKKAAVDASERAAAAEAAAAAAERAAKAAEEAAAAAKAAAAAAIAASEASQGGPVVPALE